MKFNKIILIGDSSVGKTSILQSYCHGDILDKYPQATIGVDYHRKILEKNKKKYYLELWDTAGQEKYNSMLNSYFRGADVIIIVYDINNPKSFENISYWRDKSLSESRIEPTIVVLGNKIDLSIKNHIDLTHYADIATKNNWIHTFSTSYCKKSIESFFNTFILNILNSKNKNTNKNENLIKINNKSVKNESQSCCS